MNASQLSATSRLFSAGVFREMAKKGRSPMFARLIRLAGLVEGRTRQATVGEAFDAAFADLKAVGRRDEYVYRAALVQRILMGTHSLNSACMLTEFRVGLCKADLVILNGTATVYEIKSERDSLARLANQVENYKKVFAKVCVIAGDCHIDGVLANLPRDVGLLKLSARHQISTIREAEDRPERICPEVVFESLRSAEASSILKRLGAPVPNLPNTQRHQAMRERFAKLDPVEIHMAMVDTLRRSRDLSPLRELVNRLPLSLHASALSVRVRRGDHDRIVDAVSTPLNVALAWS